MSKPLRDEHGRLRDITVGFRVSREEADDLDARVERSGLSKQDYILRKLTDREVTVIPSTRVQRALEDQMDRVYRELRRVRGSGELSPELERMCVELGTMYLALGKEPQASEVEREEGVIGGLRIS
jgi:hypothetical protein